MMVDSRAVIAEIAPAFRDSISLMWPRFYQRQLDIADADDPDAVRFRKLRASVEYLAEHFESVPLLFVAFSRMEDGGSNIFPAVWSAMLAARAEGIGATLTSIMNVFRRQQLRAALGMPDASPWEVAATVTMGYPIGRWGIAGRRPAHEVTYRDRWGSPIEPVEQPLWPN